MNPAETQSSLKPRKQQQKLKLYEKKKKLWKSIHSVSQLEDFIQRRHFVSDLEGQECGLRGDGAGRHRSVFGSEDKLSVSFFSSMPMESDLGSSAFHLHAQTPAPVEKKRRWMCMFSKTTLILLLILFFCGSGWLWSSAPSAYEPEALGKYGTLDVAFEYDSGEQWLAVTVTAATDIPELKQTGNIAWQVHLVLLPTKKQRAKTGVQKGPCPVFTETFKFSRVEQETLGDYAVRFRLYSIRRMKKEKVLGEKVFYLTKLNLQGKIALPVTLEPGSELTVRTLWDFYFLLSSDLYEALDISLTKGNTVKLTVISPLDVALSPLIFSDTYVKLTMLDSKGKEMSKCKTAVCRGQPNPTYKETFVFQVALFQLSEVSLVLTVFCRRSTMRPRERVGWVSLGLNSTSEEQQAHWAEMREAEGQQVCHWHTLTDT
uniref:Synaptotagmin XIVb n=1 Tax=Labrus bergylta TaxID=56723 RepID=A0A3Q3EHU5_9LABR